MLESHASLSHYCVHMPFLFLILLMTSYCVQTKEMDDAKDLKFKIDKFVDNIISCRNIPGLNLAIVKDGKILLTEGYGVRRLNQTHPVDNTTYFGLASLSKAFCSTLLGKVLSDKGYWYDDSMTSRIGHIFKFSDEYRTKHATFRDILAHRMGIPSNNYARIQEGFNRKQLAKTLYLFNASVDFRTTMLYNNLMYGLASYVTEKLGGDSWENLMTNNIFKPLGMDGTTFTHKVDFGDVKYATPYRVDSNTNEYRAISMQLHREWGKLGGFGSVFSTANDMAKWLLFQLNGGRNQHGDQIVDEKYLAETHKESSYRGQRPYDNFYTKPTVPISYNNYNYALGWTTGYYRGYRMVSHTGGSWGYVGLLTLIPPLSIGIYTGVNGDDSGVTARRLVHMYVMDLLMGVEPWLNETSACTFPEPWAHPTPKPTPHKKKTFNATRHLSEYTGTYGNFAYGNMTLILDHGDLCIRYGKIGRWVLHPMKDGDTFYGDGIGVMWMLQLKKVTFKANSKNKIVSLALSDFRTPTPLQFIKGLKTGDETEIRPRAQSCPGDVDQSTSDVTISKPYCVLFLLICFRTINVV